MSKRGRPTQIVPDEISPEIQEIFNDARVMRVVEYIDGWVAKAYRWRAPGRAVSYTRSETGAITASIIPYDRRRPYGIGPRAVAWSARGGRLATIH